MDPNAFYKSLWRAKSQSAYQAPGRRDWFHRLVLDPIFDPRANPRDDVALSLLAGGERFLDIGCWKGHFLEMVREKGLYRELHGTDTVSDGINEVRKKGFQAEVVDLNLVGLPFPDGYFDGVSLLAVLEHVFDPYTVIREICRVLRPRGEFVIAVPNVASFTNRLRILFGYLPVTSPDPGWDGGHLHYFTKHNLDLFLESEGFEILSRKISGGRPRLRGWWISLLAGEFIYLCRRL